MLPFTVSTRDAQLSLLPDEFTGHRFGDYEVIRRLTTGGMAEIFLAMRRGPAGFQKLVVIKRILPHSAQDEDFVGRLLEEGKVMGNFSHPNIAQVFDLGRDGDEYFLVMEFVAGVTLLELFRAAAEEKELLPLGFTLAVFRAAAQALHHAHSFVDADGRPQPVIHRDVAPKNLMLTYEGDLKLVDFGVAKTQVHRTSVGHLVGTPAYMSPEQAGLQPMDPRSDVFSLAVVLHECLTGKRLFAGDSLLSEIQAVTSRAIQRPSELNREVSAALDEVVLRGLARPREDRFGSAREFARALEGIAPTELWGPDRIAAVVQRFFPTRAQQLKALVQGAKEGLTATDVMARTTLAGVRASPVEEVAAPTVIAAKPVSPSPRGSRRMTWMTAVATLLAIASVAVVWRVTRRSPDKPLPVPSPALAVTPSPLPPPPKVESPAGHPLPAAIAPAPRREAPPAAPKPIARSALHRRTAEAAKPVAASGTLWVKARPWAQVYVDGRLQGETPLDPFSVSAGHHLVRLVNDTLKVSKSYEVEVHPNEQRDIRVDLDAAP